MKCYIDSVKTDREQVTDIKLLIPDAALRRRMSRLIKAAVSTAVECLNGVDRISDLDAIITATGWGCLTDSERFLRNIIVDNEQMLNPTPFIQSTFNTVGGQIALLRHNHCYNVTYVNRSHSFEDALLDAMLCLSEAKYKNILVGAFDESTPASHRIMERMGLFRHIGDGEGAVFAHLNADSDNNPIAQISLMDFPSVSLSEEECMKLYATSAATILQYNAYSQYGLFPTSSALCFAQAVDTIRQGAEEVILYNEYMGATPTVLRLQCVG